MRLLPSHLQVWRVRLAATVLSLAAAASLAASARAQDAQPQSSSQGANAGAEAPATAASAPAQKPDKPYAGGTPLDVIMHTKLWETVPEAKDFVKETRQPEDALHYMPTQVFPPKDADAPLPPKVLNSGELKSLEGELDVAGAHNERAAGVKAKNFVSVKSVKTVRTKTAKPPHKEKILGATAAVPAELH